MPNKPTLDFVYFDAGGGHRSAAMAIQSVIAENGYEWDVRLVNLQEILDPLDIFRKLIGIRLQDIYNVLLAKGWTLGSAYLLPAMHGIIRLYHPAQLKLLTRFWKERQPDMVVSLIPNFNRALFQSLEAACPGAPFVTILTDFADYPPHFWIEKQPQYFICGTDRAMQQVSLIGHPAAQAFRVSGMVLRPQFYARSHSDRAVERARLGLDPNLPTGIVLFGGEGSNVMLSFADRLGNSQLDLQLIMICGRNAALKRRLEARRTRNRLLVEGFTKDMPYFMHLSDFLIGKPGPGSVSEALQMQLPVIVERNSWTLPQERYNAEWLQEQRVGIVLKNFREIEAAVRALLKGNMLQEMRANVAQMQNRAVFEIPAILEKVLAGRTAALPKLPVTKG